MSVKSWLRRYYPIPADKVSKRDALTHSRRKWEGARVENLRKHGLTGPPITFNGDTCALCLHYNHDNGCSGCPLSMVREGVACDERSAGENVSPYTLWDGDRNPTPMLILLDAALARFTRKT